MQSYFGLNTSVDSLFDTSTGMNLFYEVDPRISKPQFPDAVDKYDSNNNVSSDYTRLVCNLACYEKLRYQPSMSKNAILPRLMWVNKKSTLKELHIQVFSFFKSVLAEWIDWKDPNTKK